MDQRPSLRTKCLHEKPFFYSFLRPFACQFEVHVSYAGEMKVSQAAEKRLLNKLHLSI